MKRILVFNQSLFLVISLVCLSCGYNKNNSKTTQVDNKVKDTAITLALRKLNLPYSVNMVFDSSALLFYCSRPLDTSSLFQVVDDGGTIHGVFYQALPTYHSYINDFAEPNSKLLFFEGYSFLLDSVMWKNIQEQAKTVLMSPDTLSKRLAYTDSKSYILCHNNLLRRGDSNEEVLFETLDRFFKDSLLLAFMKKRKPKMFKVK